MDDRRVYLNYGVSEIPVEALTRYDPARDELVVVVSPDTYRGLKCERPRSRFALCHEIGHAVLHFKQAIRLAGIAHHKAALLRGGQPSHKPFYDTEWQANAFAAALLMPAAGLAELERQHKLDSLFVEHHFMVSHTAAELRIALYNKRKAQLLA